MDSKITQNYFLLSLNPQKGYYYNMGTEFSYGLLGAILMDLYKANRISLANRVVTIVDASPANARYFDRVLELLQQKRSMRIGSLISRMGFRANRYKQELAEQLIQEKLLIKVRKKFLFIPYNRYYPNDREQRMSIIRRLRDILLRKEQPLPEEMYLLSLIRITRLFRALSDRRDERSAMRQQLKLIMAHSSDFTNDHQNLEVLHNAIKRAIMAAHAAKSAH
ncbi:MAG: GPP34 family phosphoprotein [Prolixibacteraceae bacterium]